MEEMLKLSAFCIACSLLVVVIDQGSRIMGMLVALTAGVLLSVFILEKIKVVTSQFLYILEAAEIGNELILPLFKVLGIALCARISGALCRDMGSQWAASTLEIFAVLSSLICMLPLLENVLRLVHYL